MQIPYYRNTTYRNEKELFNILDNTVTAVVSHAHLSRYKNPTLCQTTWSSNGVLMVELEVANHDVINPDYYAKKDLKTLQGHFSNLKEKCGQEYRERYWKQQDLWANYTWESHQFGYSLLEFEFMHTRLINMDFVKNAQFFLFANIIFLNLHRSAYDRHGLISELEFIITPDVETDIEDAQFFF